MYKYTPKKSLLIQWQRLLEDPRKYDARWKFWSEFSNEYSTKVALYKHWENTCFYTENKVGSVPVGGYLVDSYYFDVEKV